MYRTERNYENLNKGIFPGAGRFDIPILRPELTTAENWISFNYAKGCEEPSEHGVHFFVDDYQFNRIWAPIGRPTASRLFRPSHGVRRIALHGALTVSR